MIRFRGPDNFVFQHIARLGMSYSELLIGVYFCKYKFMDRIENAWNKLPIKRGKILLLTLLTLVVIVVRRFVPTLLIAPISGMVFVVAYLLAVRQHRWLGRPFAFLGKHSTNIWLTHMFFYMPMYGGIVFHVKYAPLVLVVLIAICIIISYSIIGIEKGIEKIR